MAQFNRAQAILDAVMGQRNTALNTAAELAAQLREAKDRIAELEARKRAPKAVKAGPDA
jgi:hypothetical protein